MLALRMYGQGKDVEIKRSETLFRSLPTCSFKLIFRVPGTNISERRFTKDNRQKDPLRRMMSRDEAVARFKAHERIRLEQKRRSELYFFSLLIDVFLFCSISRAVKS